MELKEMTKGQIKIFQISGRLDSRTSKDFDEAVSAAIEVGIRVIVVDCKALSYISSAGLRVILKAARQLNLLEGRIVLCGMQEYIREVFEIGDLHEIMPIVPTLDDALNEI